MILLSRLQRSPLTLNLATLNNLFSSAFSCVLHNKMSIDFKNEEDVKEYINNIGIEYRYGCFSEKNPEACQLLGDYLDAIKKDYNKAAKIYKANCDDYNHPRSCHSYGNYAVMGKGMSKRNEEEALIYYQKACELDINTSCFNAGIMSLRSNPEVKREKDYTKGLKLLDKACTLQHGNACYYISGIYITGQKDVNLNRDMKKAFEYSEKACNLGNIYACANLSIMYKKGEGVEKNEEMSEKFKKRTQELKEEIDSNFQLEFQRGSGS